jgi:predicted RNA-binding Zn-ribbon protein involved in translation (DUF1610 family)
MRFELVEVVPGITRSVPYLQCWRCGDDVLETDLSDRDLCPRGGEVRIKAARRCSAASNLSRPVTDCGWSLASAPRHAPPGQ